MNTLIIKKSIQGYTVTSHDFVASFGTDTIPTAFTANAEPELVLRTIQRLNPEYKVILIG